MAWRALLGLVLVPAGLYLALLTFVFFLQSRLIYFPQMGRELATTPSAVGLEFESVALVTQDGETLSAWWVPAAKSRGTVLIFHGNAGNISHRLGYLQMFHELGYSGFIIDYRGYGRSTGTPSEQGTYRDAEAAWAWLTRSRAIPADDIVILGESLGGAIATWLAARERPRALILTQTFTSATDLGAELYPFLPVRWLSRFEYDNLARIGSVDAPVLIAHAPEDRTIPYSHGRALFDAAREPKQFLKLSGGHNDGLLYARPAWIEAVGAFLVQARPDRSASSPAAPV